MRILSAFWTISVEDKCSPSSPQVQISFLPLLSLPGSPGSLEPAVRRNQLDLSSPHPARPLSGSEGQQSRSPKVPKSPTALETPPLVPLPQAF